MESRASGPWIPQSVTRPSARVLDEVSSTLYGPRKMSRLRTRRVRRCSRLSRLRQAGPSDDRPTATCRYEASLDAGSEPGLPWRLSDLPGAARRVDDGHVPSVKAFTSLQSASWT